jgi:hypothetical protein
VIGAELGADLLVMLVASYVIYFSLEGAGERLGRDTELYKEAERLCRAKQKEIPGDAIGRLREFCIRYSREELDYRRRAALMAAGLTSADYLGYIGKRGEEPGEREEGSTGGDEGGGVRAFGRKEKQVLRKTARMKPVALSPVTLLGGGVSGSGSELKNPERHKLLHLFVGLIPTTLCMLFTVSMMITAKSGLDTGTVISGIVKLSTLPMIAMRGYSKGYDYSRHTLTAWLETKTKLLSAFIGECGGETDGR